MVLIEGKYAHEKSENLDEYFKANGKGFTYFTRHESQVFWYLGVPYIPRKMMCASNPTVEISKSGDTWTITTSTMFRTIAYTFKLGEEYEERMPGAVLKASPVFSLKALYKDVIVEHHDFWWRQAHYSLCSTEWITNSTNVHFFRWRNDSGKCAIHKAKYNWKSI